MTVELSPEQARLLLDILPQPEQEYLGIEEIVPYKAALERLEGVVESDLREWFKHLVAQGKHPNEAREHVRHRFGVEL